MCTHDHAWDFVVRDTASKRRQGVGLSLQANTCIWNSKQVSMLIAKTIVNSTVTIACGTSIVGMGDALDKNK
jgi:hypothetical protein